MGLFRRKRKEVNLVEVFDKLGRVLSSVEAMADEIESLKAEIEEVKEKIAANESAAITALQAEINRKNQYIEDLFERTLRPPTAHHSKKDDAKDAKDGGLDISKLNDSKKAMIEKWIKEAANGSQSGKAP